MFDALTSWLEAHGLQLLLGTTAVLGAGIALVHTSRALRDRHRAACVALLAIAAYLVVAVVPMPRLMWRSDAGAAAATAPDASRAVATPMPADDPGPAAHPSVATPSVAAPSFAAPAPTPSASTGARDAVEPTHAAMPIDAAATTIEPKPREAAPATVMLFPALAVALLLGASAWLALLALGVLRLRSIVRDSDPAPREVHDLVPLPKRTRICIARRPTQPFCFGVLRPTIVLPQDLAGTDQATRFVLQHECAHLTSGDVRARLLAALLRPALFWHPLFWWLNHQLRYSGELLADDAAAAMPDGGVADYVRCMMTLSTHTDRAAGTPLAATIFRRRSELFRRLETMLQRDEAIPRTLSRAGRALRATAATALVAITAGTFGVEPVTAQDPGDAAHRRQVRALRQEIEQMRAELEALRAERGFGVAVDTPPSPRVYVVKRGDTLAEIANRELGSVRHVRTLQHLNPDLDPMTMRPGQKLQLPPLPKQSPRADTIPPGLPHGRGDRTEPDAALGGAPIAPAPAAIPDDPFGTRQDAPRGLPGAHPSSRPQTSDHPLLDPLATGAPTPTPDKRQQAGNRATGGDSGLSDLVGLVERCIELRGDVEIQTVMVKNAESEMDKAVAKIRLHTKEQQLDAIRQILKQEIELAAMQLDQVQRLFDKGYVGQQELHRTKAKLHLLERGLK